MATLRLPLEDLRAGERVVSDAAARYLTRVRRLATGARLVAFDPAARLEADAEIVAAGTVVRLRLEPPRPARNVPARAVTVVQAAGKGGKIDDVLRDATELGATRFVVAVAERSVRRPEAQAARWRRVAVEAARQCGRGDVPDIVGPVPFTEAVALAAAPISLLLDPTGQPLRALGAGPIALAVGPEGGFSPAEIAAATQLGYRVVSLGPFVLRTETACAAALGAIAALSR